MDRALERPDAFAVDQADLKDAAGLTFAEVVEHQAFDLGGAEGMEVKNPVDGNLNGRRRAVWGNGIWRGLHGWSETCTWCVRVWEVGVARAKTRWGIGERSPRVGSPLRPVTGREGRDEVGPRFRRSIGPLASFCGHSRLPLPTPVAVGVSPR